MVISQLVIPPNIDGMMFDKDILAIIAISFWYFYLFINILLLFLHCYIWFI